MLSFASSPIPSGSWDHRPVVSSPLSSSFVRASSPLSPIDSNVLSQRQAQSSPIQPPKFKFVARPSRPNPVVRRREEAQEQRRKTFLQSVRQKSENKAWMRRDIEGHFLKTSYLDGIGQLVHDAPDVSEADIEDAMAFRQESSPSRSHSSDDMMMDAPPDEGDEMEVMTASFLEQQQPDPCQPLGSPAMSDEDYDEIFAELIAQEQQTTQTKTHSTHQPHMTDTTNNDNAMSL